MLEQILHTNLDDVSVRLLLDRDLACLTIHVTHGETRPVYMCPHLDKL